MKINVGIAQIPNSADLEKNFSSIMTLLERFKAADVDLVLFPECSLSGFTAKMKECNLALIKPYLDQIRAWANQSGIDVVLPTAVAEHGRVYNCGYWFKAGGSNAFYKIGLTESEKKFFSQPEIQSPKVFETKGFRFAVLICFEAQHEPWAYFKNGEVDAILWPGYWGWTPEDQWGSEKEPGKPNLIYSNLAHWRLPILQANFAMNDLEGHSGAGPEGLSFVIGPDNLLIGRGPHKQSGGLVVALQKDASVTTISKCIPLM